MKLLIKSLPMLVLALTAMQVSANTNNTHTNTNISPANDVMNQVYKQTNTHDQGVQTPSINLAVVKQNAIHDLAVPSAHTTGIISLLPMVTISDIVIMNTVVIPVDSLNEQTMDVSTLDNFLLDIAPNVRHYPPNFRTKTQRYNTREHLERYVKWIATFADNDNASYEVLIRAAQLNGMARNLDMGSDYAVRASNYVGRALVIRPNDLEANLLYGIMLSEGGAFKTSLKYLNKVVTLGSIEAEQTIAQSDLMNDKREEALIRLQNLTQLSPDSNTAAQLAQQIAIVEEGKYRIWDLPAADVNVKPLP